MYELNSTWSQIISLKTVFPGNGIFLFVILSKTCYMCVQNTGKDGILKKDVTFLSRPWLLQ